MPPTLVSGLREHRMASLFKSEGELISPSERGTPLDGGNMVRREFKPALRRARLPLIRFHDLRHTFASPLIPRTERRPQPV
jgi:integrase